MTATENLIAVIEERMSNYTLRAIAREAGLSYVTVLRVAHGKRRESLNVSSLIKIERAMDAIDEGLVEQADVAGLRHDREDSPGAI